MRALQVATALFELGDLKLQFAYLGDKASALKTARLIFLFTVFWYTFHSTCGSRATLQNSANHIFDVRCALVFAH